MVELNQYGFYTLINKPSNKELIDYYSKKYYQTNQGAYKKTYTKEEKLYINNKIEQKFYLFKDKLKPKENYLLLDVGCGEGHTLKYFKNKGWKVMGLDYSGYGIKTHTPECMDNLLAGDIYENLSKLNINRKEGYDVIWLDNVLEHVLEPLILLELCYSLGNDKSFLLIEVPNDFSKLQIKLKQEGLIKNDYWIISPDHISYFNKNGLINICDEANWKHVKTISDFPIDFNLFNPNANYNIDKQKGEGAHLQRIKIENLLHEISVEKTIELYEALANLGLGRQTIGLFEK